MHEVQPNTCQCHPETCSCNDWVIVRDGKRHSTYFHRHVADEVCASLNAAIFQQRRIDDLRAALGNFANPQNWELEPGNLRWTGKRNAIDFARSVLDEDEAVGQDTAGR
jgi:hypothetical protein